jgi:hypothetical protein
MMLQPEAMEETAEMEVMVVQGARADPEAPGLVERVARLRSMRRSSISPAR